MNIHTHHTPTHKHTHIIVDSCFPVLVLGQIAHGGLLMSLSLPPSLSLSFTRAHTQIIVNRCFPALDLSQIFHEYMRFLLIYQHVD